jgi:hypothetical protein
VSDEEYTNLDLDTAEELLIAAGKRELAVALRYQAQGVRNLVQGEWGRSFVGALENIMDTRVVNVLASVQQQLDQQIALAQQILTTAKDAQKTARQALSVSKAGAARLGKLEDRMDASEADRADLRARLERIERIMAERPEQREAEHQALLKAIRDGGHIHGDT